MRNKTPPMSQWDDVQRRLDRVKTVAGMLDDRFSIPGTRIRFGLDSIAGLIPGIGDSATAIAGMWLVVEAARLKVPKRMLVKMLLNIAVDFVFGSIPILGDLFDVYWKSNRRNTDLLEKHLKQFSADDGLIDAKNVS